MTFWEIGSLLEQGKKIARQGWNGKGMWLSLVEEDRYYFDRGYLEYANSPWVGMKTADNKFVPWQPSQTDMLAKDWMIVE